MLDFVFEVDFRTFKRLLYAFATGVVLPSMIRAADAVVLDESIVERYSAVRAVLADETVGATAVPVQHQIFTEDPQFLFWFLVAELGGCRHHVPVASEELACRSPRTDACEQFVFIATE